MTSLLVQADWLIARHRPREAAELLHRAIAEYPRDPRCYARLASCYLDMNRLWDADRLAREAIRYGPDLSESYRVMAQVLAEQAGEMPGGMLFALESQIRRRMKHFGHAEKAMLEAIRLDPECADLYEQLAWIRIEREAMDSALDAADRGLALDAEHLGCANVRARTLALMGRFKEAEAMAHAALTFGPDDAVTHANRGWALLHTGDVDQALQHFGEALRLDATDDWARAGLIEALKSRHRFYRYVFDALFWVDRAWAQRRWRIVLYGALAAGLVILLASGFYEHNRWVGVCWYLLGVTLILNLVRVTPFISHILISFHPVGKFALSEPVRVMRNLAILVFTWLATVMLAMQIDDARTVLSGSIWAALAPSLFLASAWAMDPGAARRRMMIAGLGVLALSALSVLAGVLLGDVVGILLVATLLISSTVYLRFEFIRLRRSWA